MRSLFFFFISLVQSCQFNFQCSSGPCWNHTCYSLNQTIVFQPNLLKEKECALEFSAYHSLFYEEYCPIKHFTYTDFGLVIHHLKCQPQNQSITLDLYKQINFGYIEYTEPFKAACIYNKWGVPTSPKGKFLHFV